MLSNEQILELYSNRLAFNKYDKLLEEMIDYLFQIKQYELEENYERCKVKYDFIMNLIAFRCIEINRLTNINSNDLHRQFINDYEDLKEHIYKQ